MGIYLLCFYLITWILSKKVIIYTSDKTSVPSDYLAAYQFNTYFDVQVQQVSSSSQIELISQNSEFDITIDYTEQLSMSYMISKLASDQQKFNFAFHQRIEPRQNYSEFTFQGNQDIESLFKSFWNFGNDLFGFQQYALMISPEIVAVSTFDNFWADLFKTTVYLSNNYENIKRQIGSELRAQGLQNTLIISYDQNIAFATIQALEAKFIGIAGYRHAIISDSVHILLNNPEPVSSSLLDTGLVILVRKGLENAQTVEQVAAMKVDILLGHLKNIYEEHGYLSEQNLIDWCFNSQHRFSDKVYMLNSQYGNLVLLSEYDAYSYDLYQFPIYPGGVKGSYKPEKIPIEFSLLDFVIPGFIQGSTQGTFLALSQIEDSDLPHENYELLQHYFENDDQVLSDDYIENILNYSEQNGYNIWLFALTFDNNLYIPLIDYQNANNATTVNILPNAISEVFSDPESFPMVNKIAYKFSDFITSSLLMYQFLGWQRTALFYDKAYDVRILYYDLMLEAYLSEDIEVLGTSADHGYLSGSTKDEFLENSMSYLDQIIESRARLIHILPAVMPQWNWIMEYLYEAGLRRSDIQVVFGLDITAQIQTTNLDSNTSLYELYDYTINNQVPMDISPEIDLYPEFALAFQNEFGYFPQIIFCYSYDAVYYLTYGIQNTILSGQDIEIPEVLNLYLRSVTFSGCSGYVSMEKQTNDRNLVGFKIQQSIYNSETQNFDQNLAGTYNAKSETVFSLPDIQWPSGSIPTDTRPFYKDCPFEEYQIQESETGKFIIQLAFILWALYGIFVMLLLWIKYRNFRTEMLVKLSFYELGDFVYMILHTYERIQHLGLIPNLLDPSTQNAIAIISNLTLAASELHHDAYNQSYLWYSIALLSIVTVFMVQLAKWKLDILFTIKLLFIAVLSTIMYIPCLQMFLDIYMCSQEAKSNAFFDSDCNNECWTNTHYLHIVFSTLGLISYIPIAILLRIWLQEVVTDLHILLRPNFIIIKASLTLVMVWVAKALPDMYASIGLFILTLVLIIITVIIRPYNYARMNLYSGTMQMIQLIIIVVCAIPVNVTVQAIFIVVFTIVMIVYSLNIQRKLPHLFPKLLIFPKAHAIEGLIRFELTKRNRSTSNYRMSI